VVTWRASLALCSLFILLFGAPARAEWQFAPFIGFTFGGDTTLLDLDAGADKNHWNFGGTATLLGKGPIGVEGLFSYTPGFFESDEAVAPPNTSLVTSSHVYALMGNIVLTTPARWSEYGLRPYVSGGVGLLHASQRQTQNVFPISSNLFGFDVGGGAVGFITNRTGLRFDLRYYSTLRRDEEAFAFGRVRLSYWNAGVGVVLRY
jgi:hypothetical protein